MKITLSLEKTVSNDVSIMVDVLRASTTITYALDKFNTIIPCFTPEEAFDLKNETDALIAGERGGKKINGFDLGNSPVEICSFKSKKEQLILTTSNGTRILKDMDSTVLIGCLANGESVAKRSLELGNTEIDVVMAGVKGEFAIEDYLAAGEILYQIARNCDYCEISEYAKSAILASRNYNMVKKAFYESRSGKRLKKLGHMKDIAFCLNINTTDNVGIYHNNSINRLDLNMK